MKQIVPLEQNYSNGTNCSTRIKKCSVRTKTKICSVGYQILSVERKNVLLEQNYSFKTNGKKQFHQNFLGGKKRKRKKEIVSVENAYY